MSTETTRKSQWCLVGNIVDRRPLGPDNPRQKPGSRHFSAGTKVYCLPAQWGDGYDQMIVIGRHRGADKLVQMIINGDWIENFRAMVVYPVEIIRRLEKTAQQSGLRNWRSRQEVQAYIVSIKQHRASRAT
jgi:hypothetical protein